ncbi:MAG: MBL fold metallo-hydrolase [Acidobacteria bacterium]|nr:MAG: MBL fold metallo-hydrolase [Acidobacteriota bacterium]PYQ22695.1 MAG: MBL fold metallo-hydrolase [Acidobacteriota bacterium]
MARVAERLPENVPGSFFVDSSCIDCGACRVVDPDHFRAGPRSLSIVHRQPRTEAERVRALMALVACPTSSIGTEPKQDAAPGVAAFPERLDAEGEVYFCGFTAERSFGATSYLVRRSEGNVLVDSPRAAAPLVRRLEELGGVRWMFLSHRDDVADHRRFRDRFGCERILHARDVTSGTRDVERKVEGDEPQRLDDDLLVVPVPGHTAGSAVLLYRERFLFTGDHLMATEDGRRLEAARDVCWYSWPEQVRSMEKLLDLRFEWVLPGHGGRYRAASAAAMRRELEGLIARMHCL